MRRLMKGLRHGEKGFTLIELLIVIAILGIIAAIVIPNVMGFMTAGTLNAANTEEANIKTAEIAYYAEHSAVWPGDSDDLTDYIQGTLRAFYGFSSADGSINNADATITNGWGTVVDFDVSLQQWVRGTTGQEIP